MAPETREKLTTEEAITGMLALFGPERSFSAEQLRDFLREEGQGFPSFLTLLNKAQASLFRDGLDMVLHFSLHGSLVRDTKFGGGNLVVSAQGIKNQLRMLERTGILPTHEEFLKGLAERFEQRLARGHSGSEPSERDKQLARQLIESAERSGELHSYGSLNLSIRSRFCDKCRGLLMTEDLVEEHQKAHEILGE